jgi:hypothetical protein
MSEWKSRIVGHEKVRADQLMANPFNHRQHPMKQRKVVAASIKEIGFVKSVLVNKLTGRIVDGHERVMQALDAGDETLVDVEYVELSEEDELKALLLLDASSELADVNKTKVQELASMVEFDIADLTDFAKEIALNFGNIVEDKDGEWQGMPDFKNDEIKEIQLIVYFPSMEAKVLFCKQVEQTVTQETKFVWFPKEAKPVRQDVDGMRVE